MNKAAIEAKERWEEKESLNALKMSRNEAIRKAEILSHEYFAACEVGEERNRAADIFEKIRTALRLF